jgi:hypothetical protein
MILCDTFAMSAAKKLSDKNLCSSPRRNPLARGLRAPRQKTKTSFSRQPKRGRGRPKGSTNFFTRDMNDPIIDACNENPLPISQRTPVLLPIRS